MLWVDPEPVLVILIITRIPGRLTRTGTEGSYPFGLLMTCSCTIMHTRTESVLRPCSVTERPLFPIHIL